MSNDDQKIGVLVNCPINKVNRAELPKLFDLHFAEEVPNRDELLAEVGENIQIIVSDGPRHIDVPLMDQLPNLKLVCLQSVGLDHLDLEAAKDRGIHVTNATGTNAPSCADHAFALMLAVSRHILANDKSMRENEAYEECAKFHSTTVYGKKIGILGLGTIGCEIAKRAVAFDMDIYYHNRSERDDVPYTYCKSLLELAKEVQILAISCPGGEATRNIVNASVLEALGPGGTLVNIARGTIVDTNDLVRALQSGAIKNAGLDVIGGEAQDRIPLCSMDNVVMSPHLAGNTEEAWLNRSQLTRTVLTEFLDGKELTNQVC
jgi:lactate dehydrogenase-like 2-hydroxyacid dehydrogenase